MFNPAFLEIGIAKPNTPNRDASDKALGFTRFLGFQGMLGGKILQNHCDLSVYAFNPTYRYTVIFYSQTHVIVDFTINIILFSCRRELGFPTLSGLGHDSEGTSPTEEMLT